MITNKQIQIVNAKYDMKRKKEARRKLIVKIYLEKMKKGNSYHNLRTR